MVRIPGLSQCLSIGFCLLIWPVLPCCVQGQSATMEEVYELANERMVDRDIVDDAFNLERDFAKHGSAGYRAICLLIETGHSKGTPMLPMLKATWSRGDEQDLLELCKKEVLANYGHCIALQGLGYADTLEVREYLSERIMTERDPGNFYSTALALGTLDETGSVDVIGEQVLKFEEGWQGVEQYLIGSIMLMDVEFSVPWVEKYVRDPEAKQYQSPLSFMQKHDPERSKNVAAEVLAKREDLNSQQKWWLERFRDYQIPKQR